MTVYYVDFVNGLDANNGLGPDASHATNKPWKTITKLLGAAGLASGDTAYLSPGSPFREVVTVAMTSATAETSIIGDPTNLQGFKTAAGVRVLPGDIIWTAYTTNDTTLPSTSALLNLAGRDFLTFKNILMVGGNNSSFSCVNGVTTNSTNIVFRDCSLIITGGPFFSYTGLADVASNWTIDRCRMIDLSGGVNTTGLSLILPTSAVADYDSNFLIQNCIILGGSVAINIAASGAAAFKGGGSRYTKLHHITRYDYLDPNPNQPFNYHSLYSL